MSAIGYYRLKTTVIDGATIALFKNGIQDGIATIKAIEHCTGYRTLKYLDSKGRYRFYSFTNFYESSDAPENIGRTNEFITNILSDQTNSKNLGYRNKRILALSAQVDSDDLEIFSEIYTSPRVYLYVGAGISDVKSDWVELESVTGDNINRRRKQKTALVNLQCTLPEWFTTKMI